MHKGRVARMVVIVLPRTDPIKAIRGIRVRGAYAVVRPAVEQAGHDPAAPALIAPDLERAGDRCEGNDLR